MVLAVHVGYNFEWIAQYTVYGYYGTTLFFALSGYLIIRNLDEKKQRLSTYYKKRVVRIIPLYYALLLFNFFERLITTFPSQGIKTFAYDGLCSVKNLRYFLFLQMFIPSDSFSVWNNVIGLWTMSAFAFFYLIAPFISKLIRNYFCSLVVFLTVLALKDPWVNWLEKTVVSIYPNVSKPSNFASWLPFSVMYCFLAGICIYHAHKEKKQFSFSLILIVFMVFTKFQKYQFDLGLFLLMQAAVELPDLLGDADRNIRVRKIISIFSDFSFALYLSHILVLEQVMKLQGILVPVIRNKGFLLFTFACCIFAGYLVRQFIDKPLTKKFGEWFGV